MLIPAGFHLLPHIKIRHIGLDIKSGVPSTISTPPMVRMQPSMPRSSTTDKPMGLGLPGRPCCKNAAVVHIKKRPAHERIPLHPVKAVQKNYMRKASKISKPLGKFREHLNRAGGAVCKNTLNGNPGRFSIGGVYNTNRGKFDLHGMRLVVQSYKMNTAAASTVV